jgi:Spy/CpxP family protein refolding chaperone
VQIKKVLLMFMISILVIPAVASAQPMMLGGPGVGPIPMPLMMVLRRVNLTADQQTKVHQILAASFAQAQPLMKQLHDIHEEIGDKLMSTGTVNAADIEPLQQQENQIHQQLDEQTLSAALQIRGLLTPEQLSKAADLHAKLKSLRQQTDELMGGNEQFWISGPPPGF